MKRPDPVEIAQIAIPVLAEAVAVSLFIAAIMVWVIIRATPTVPV